VACGEVFDVPAAADQKLGLLVPDVSDAETEFPLTHLDLGCVQYLVNLDADPAIGMI